MKRLLRSNKVASSALDPQLLRDAARGRVLIEESREAVLVLDERGRLLRSSRRAREMVPDLEEGVEPPPLRDAARVSYQVDDVRETLVYLERSRDVASYEELRSGFTAAVSHELRTPLARLLALLDSALLPGADVTDLVERARLEVEQAAELIDDVLFLSALETGREVVALGSARAMPIVRQVLSELQDAAVRAGVALEAAGEETIDLPLRPRMVHVLVENLAANAIRYAGHGATFTLSLARDEQGRPVLAGRDDGIGVGPEHLPRLFERFYRADPARSSRGTGLGLAIVKHIVVAAGGVVEAHGERGAGLEVRSVFPV